MNTNSQFIPFNLPTPVESGIDTSVISGLGKGKFKAGCEKLLSEQLHGLRVLLTPSCSASLEMSALSIGIQPGDEVILPSFTFVTSASAFALRGAKLIFVDIRPDTLNIDEKLIEEAITEKTKAVVVVHYAGVACEMESIKAICKKYQIALVEDAAQGIGAFYKETSLGTIADYGCISFHHTKNIHAGGEGGALIVNDVSAVQRVEILQEKGTDRSRFLRGEVDKYTWQELSSSYVMSEVQGAVLYDQLTRTSEIISRRLAKWSHYYKELLWCEDAGFIKLPDIPRECQHNAHIFYMILPSQEIRDSLLMYLKGIGIEATTHYVPLHTSPAGRKYSRFFGKDQHTTRIANSLLRLPLYDSLPESEQSYIISSINMYFKDKRFFIKMMA
ncbi:dTDP-4-amino-4,6-dideoxygalactose transaminase [Rheinheimera sp. F8]|uniref:dTDP-4-amino-4,6-dideoxygalactose transaminase n=1 Tax=Rheinheimera sp. F8 TaxID=1763998 RepID=UPI000744C9ED|nr:dTDP-4-amino-4,6-dideoxygalactose transaminase [Rheinheimera sp. F8]ALZ74310.1 TDP-4-oxo-6-deoxy-D-glucose aminotransferase [Rheinheimera sp. F8]